MREYTVFHEIAHYIGAHLKIDRNEEWLSLSSWKQVNKQWTQNNVDPFPSLYAQENPAEDFAESVCAYRFNPIKLKNNSQVNIII